MALKRPLFLYLLLSLISLQPALSAAKHPEKAKRLPRLGERIEAILADPEVARGFWGIEVVSLGSGRVLYSQNGEKLFTPASNTKLFTTAATLALIGPDYHSLTTVETTAVLDKYGRLNGDLVLVGRGDPNISGRTLPYNIRTERKPPYLKVLEELADQVAAKGVKYVDGDVVGDDSYFAFERYGEGWTQDDLVWEWGAPVSALTVNDNVMFMNIMPADRPGERAFVSLEPFAEYYRIDNRVMTTPAGTGAHKIFLNREPGSNQVTLWGNMPLDDAGDSEVLAIEDPADFAAQLFRELLERRGIVVYGRARTRHSELANLSTIKVTATAGGGDTPSSSRPAPAQPLVLASHQSPPLAQDLRVINKVSQNLHAEIMLRLLGRERGTAGTIEGGLEVLREWLSQAPGIQPDGYALFDGSGLSRQNLVTPRAIVKLLEYAARQPWFSQFQESLPVAGVDGSLGPRFRETPASGRVRAKTGTLGHVNALSGYIATMSGDQVAFAILGNNHKLNGKRALETIDRIVLEIVNDGQP